MSISASQLILWATGSLSPARMAEIDAMDPDPVLSARAWHLRFWVRASGLAVCGALPWSRS